MINKFNKNQEKLLKLNLNKKNLINQKINYKPKIRKQMMRLHSMILLIINKLEILMIFINVVINQMINQIPLKINKIINNNYLCLHLQIQSN